MDKGAEISPHLPPLFSGLNQLSTLNQNNLHRIPGPVHQQDFKLGQLVVVEIHGVGGRGHCGIEIHERDHGAVRGNVVDWQYGADAACRPEARVTVLLMDLFHQYQAIAKFEEKIAVGTRRHNRLLHRRDRAAQFVEHGL